MRLAAALASVRWTGCSAAGARLQWCPEIERLDDHRGAIPTRCGTDGLAGGTVIGVLGREDGLAVTEERSGDFGTPTLHMAVLGQCPVERGLERASLPCVVLQAD